MSRSGDVGRSLKAQLGIFFFAISQDNYLLKVVFGGIMDVELLISVDNGRKWFPTAREGSPAPKPTSSFPGFLVAIVPENRFFSFEKTFAGSNGAKWRKEGRKEGGSWR